MIEFNGQLFNKVAVPRIKKFYEDKKEFLMVQAIDDEDIAQELRIVVWKELQKLSNLTEEEISRLINTIVSRRLKNFLDLGATHMNKDIESLESKPVKVNINGKDMEFKEPLVIKTKDGRVIKQEGEHVNYLPKYVNLDEIEEALLVTDNSNNLRKIELIKSILTEKEWNILEETYMNGTTTRELACQELNCAKLADCIEKTRKMKERDVTDQCICTTKRKTKQKAFDRFKISVIMKVQSILK
jgi:hypothetical protein